MVPQTQLIVVIVTVTIKARIVTVKGPKGEIVKNFRHMPLEMQIKKQAIKKRKGKFLHIRMWFGSKKQACSVSTLKTLIKNMITGVTEVRRQLTIPALRSPSFQFNNYNL